MLALPLPVGLAGAVGVDQRAGPKESPAHDSVATVLAARGSAGVLLGIAWSSGRHEQAGRGNGSGVFHNMKPFDLAPAFNCRI